MFLVVLDCPTMLGRHFRYFRYFRHYRLSLWASGGKGWYGGIIKKKPNYHPVEVGSYAHVSEADYLSILRRSIIIIKQFPLQS